MNQPKHVLDGYKVLDFTQIVAGADLYADAGGNGG